MQNNHPNVTMAAGIYPADLLPRLQDLLSALADIDLAYESDLELVQASSANEDLKSLAIGNLRQLHGRQRAPIVRQLTLLQKRLEMVS
jgi:hypothetical protein